MSEVGRGVAWSEERSDEGRRRLTAPQREQEGRHMGEAIRTEALVKSFGRTRALDGLDLAVRTGEVHGFLGPNGAGKPATRVREITG